ncbi:MAG: aldehyde dehydrogenase family protein, partial [Mycobacteriales bacterium]
MKVLQHLIEGRWAANSDGRAWTVFDPADGTPVAQGGAASRVEVGRAVAAAAAAGSSWARTSPADRGTILGRIADDVEKHSEALALLTTREMGKPLPDARGGVAAGVGSLRQYAELGPLHRGLSLAGAWDSTDFVVYEPRGVVAAITPWNDPVAVSCGLLGAALVTGNAVVYKPSERTPATCELLARLFAGALPPAVLSVLHGGGEVGALLAGQPGVDLVAHVGSTKAGKAIAAVTARTGAGMLLENGGKDPLIVDADVDPEWAADQAALGAFANAGQICTAVERAYVHEAIATPFLEALVERARKLFVGSGMEQATEMGPLVDRRHRTEVHAHVLAAQAAGAELRCGGTVPDGPGAFYPPTVLTRCTADMSIMREETFGPVIPVMVVPSFEEALSQADQGSYGLAATVLTSHMGHAQRGWRELDVGTVKINAVFGGAPGGAATPRRGSGQGYGYGPELLDEMSAAKVIH